MPQTFRYVIERVYGATMDSLYGIQDNKATPEVSTVQTKKRSHVLQYHYYYFENLYYSINVTSPIKKLPKLHCIKTCCQEYKVI